MTDEYLDNPYHLGFIPVVPDTLQIRLAGTGVIRHSLSSSKALEQQLTSHPEVRRISFDARAIALDPDILYFDEPSAGLDSISSRLLDDLILQLRDSLGATVVVVTHELASIFTIANNSVFLDAEKKTMTATGDPKQLRDETTDAKLRRFLNRGDA